MQLEQTTTDPVTRSGAAWLIVHKAPLGPEGRRAGRRREGQIPLLCSFCVLYLPASSSRPSRCRSKAARRSSGFPPTRPPALIAAAGTPTPAGILSGIGFGPHLNNRGAIAFSGLAPAGVGPGADLGVGAAVLTMDFRGPRIRLRISLTIGPNDYDGKLSDAMGEMNQKSQR